MLSLGRHQVCAEGEDVMLSSPPLFVWLRAHPSHSRPDPAILYSVWSPHRHLSRSLSLFLHVSLQPPLRPLPPHPTPELMSTTCLRGTSQAHPLSVSSVPCSACEHSHGESIWVAPAQHVWMCVSVCATCSRALDTLIFTVELDAQT